MIIELLSSLIISQSPIQIAVIDTGYTQSNLFNAPLCPTGHKDFTSDQIYDVTGIPSDLSGHGSNVAGLIHQYASNIILDKKINFQESKNKFLQLNKKNDKYCLVIVKAFSNNYSNKAYIDALKYVQSVKSIKIVNISAGGYTFDVEESVIINQMLNENKVIVAAAGNEHRNIDILQYYPASLDKRIVVVGNSDDSAVYETNNGHFSLLEVTTKFKKHASSNYGSDVDVFVDGVNMVSLSNKKDALSILTGTSQATAAFTGMIINKVLKQNNEMRKYERNSK